jgi:hypothetical protein
MLGMFGIEDPIGLVKIVASRSVGGGLKGAVYGAVGGFVLGAVGHALGTTPVIETITWINNKGQIKKFTDLKIMEEFDIYKEILVLYNAQDCNKKEFNDSCRHIQSVIFLYKRFLDTESESIMSARKITEYSIMATKSMNELLISSRASDYPESEEVEQSMMNIHLAFDEIINNIRHSTKETLPEF